MKIALLYSGHLRSIKKTSQLHNIFISQLKKKNEVKIFCQTWEEPESKTMTWWNYSDLINEENYSPNEILKNTINPDIFIINKKSSTYIKPNYYNSTITYDGIASMYYALNESFKLCEEYSSKNNWEFEIVIRMRYDIEFDYVSLLELIEHSQINKNQIFFSTNTYDFFDSYTDVLFVLVNKNKISDFFNNLNLFLQDDFLRVYFNKYTKFIPEIFISEFILQNNKILKIFLEINIVRINDEIVNVGNNFWLDTFKNSINNSEFVKKIFVDEKIYLIQLQKYLCSYNFYNLFPILNGKINYLSIYNFSILRLQKKIDKDLYFLCLRKSLAYKQNWFLNKFIRTICLIEKFQ